MKKINFKNSALLFCFLVPIFIMLTYYIMTNVYPFGNQSLLTVDLGQQYIDFFAYYRTTLLGNPGNFLYSFSKSIGGDMIGVWAYYLASPFNLIFLLFPEKMINVALLIVTLLKYGCAGLSMGFLLKRVVKLNYGVLVAFSTAYALMGFMIANQLNVMWLDAIVFLPLVIYGFDRLMTKGKFLTYSFWLAVLLLSNYYMGYMVALFLIIFFVWALFHYGTTLKNSFNQIKNFFFGSLLGGGLAAALLLPTYDALTTSKGQYTVTKIQWKFDYLPWKMISKFFTGTFNFDEMSDGLPNLFVGALVTIGFILYFINREFPLKERIAAAFVSLFFVISLSFQPLILLWHGMQYPIWYHYRFSFIISFWMVYLAALQYSRMKEGISWKQTSLLNFILLAAVAYVSAKTKTFTFLTLPQIFLSFLVYETATALYFFIDKRNKIFQLTFCLLTIFDLSFNAIISLNRISYVSESDFSVNQTALLDTIDATKSLTSDPFYRVEKTFWRTKNDAFQANYYSASHFSSTFESSVPQFMESIGSPASEGFIAYSNGTMITDALLDIRYYIEDKSIVSSKSTTDNLKLVSPLKSFTQRPDIENYHKKRETSLTRIYENENALSLGYGASTDALAIQLQTYNPIAMQSQILATLVGNSSLKDQLFTYQDLGAPILQNLKTPTTSSSYTKEKLTDFASLTYTFTPTTTDAYYLTLGTTMKPDDVTIMLNNQEVTQYDTFNNTVILNLTAAQKDKLQTLKVVPKGSTVTLDNFHLYSLNSSAFQSAIKTLKTEPLKISTFSNTHLNGTIQIKKGHQMMMTSIPYSKNWHVSVDGKTVTPKKAMDTFLAVPLSQGKHTVKMWYWPHSLTIGINISVFSILISLLLYFLPKRKKKDFSSSHHLHKALSRLK